MKRLLYMLYGVVLQHKMCGVVAKFFSKRGVLGEIVLCRWSLIFSAYAIWKFWYPCRNFYTSKSGAKRCGCGK
jgi:hypothetical protein